MGEGRPMMVSTSSLVTAEQLFQMPDDGKRRELIRGRLIEMSPVGGQHGYVVSNVDFLIKQYVRQQRLGVVLVGDPGVVLERAPDTVRAPDLAYYSHARWTQVADPTRYLEVCPELVVEVVSPSDRPGEVREKVQAWRTFGVALIWVVDPQRLTVAAHQADGSVVVIGQDGEVDGATVLPGFRAPVRAFFE
jgi:Uma2 family endonuclease